MFVTHGLLTHPNPPPQGPRRRYCVTRARAVGIPRCRVSVLTDFRRNPGAHVFAPQPIRRRTVNDVYARSFLPTLGPRPTHRPSTAVISLEFRWGAKQTSKITLLRNLSLFTIHRTRLDFGFLTRVFFAQITGTQHRVSITVQQTIGQHRKILLCLKRIIENTRRP